MLDEKVIIIVTVGGCLLIVSFMMTGFIISRYIQAMRRRKAAEKSCVKMEENSAIVMQSTPVSPLPSTTIQMCEECSQYATYNGLPPCFCDTNEGL